MIVSIAGGSGVGKTTLAARVAAALGARLLHLDRYFIRSVERPIVNGYPSFERPELYDGKSMARAARLSGGHVVMEGFLALTYPEVRQASDIAFFVDAPFALRRSRRLARTRSGGNPTLVGMPGVDKDHDTGWLAHGEDEWRRFGASQASLPGVIILNGSDTQDALLRSCMAHLRSKAAQMKERVEWTP